MAVLWVASGGALGAVARYVGVKVCVAGLGLAPAGATLVVNVLGCFLIGILLSVLMAADAPREDVRLFFAVGVLGSFTTFSTFGWETWELVRAQQTGAAVLNVLLHLGLGLAAVWVGMFFSRGLAS